MPKYRYLFLVNDGEQIEEYILLEVLNKNRMLYFLVYLFYKNNSCKLLIQILCI